KHLKYLLNRNSYFLTTRHDFLRFFKDFEFYPENNLKSFEYKEIINDLRFLIYNSNLNFSLPIDTMGGDDLEKMYNLFLTPKQIGLNFKNGILSKDVS